MGSKRRYNYPASVLKTKKAFFQRPIVVVHRPDEISATEISLGRQRRKERKGKNLIPSGKSNDRIVMDINKLSSEIIVAAIELDKALAPGLLKTAYEQCLCHELNLRGLSYESKGSLAVRYKGIKLDCDYRLDIVVEDKIILE